MVSQLSDENLWLCYQQWRCNSNKAYIKWYTVVEVATNPKIKKTVATYQKLGDRETEYLEEMWNCDEMSKPYLAELVRRGLVEEGMIQ